MMLNAWSDSLTKQSPQFSLSLLQVGKTGRTVAADAIEIQYVIIIGEPLLTYLLTCTDRLERAVVKDNEPISSTFCQ